MPEPSARPNSGEPLAAYGHLVHDGPVDQGAAPSPPSYRPGPQIFNIEINPNSR
jgi:hypothetical protein